MSFIVQNITRSGHGISQIKKLKMPLGILAFLIVNLPYRFFDRCSKLVVQ